jgi:hypothetical protein
MGNANGRQSGTSSPRHQAASSTPHQSARTFDGGSLSPHGIYTGRPDYNRTNVLKYIGERRLAPFYKGLDDYDEEWTDYQLSHMVKEGKLPPTADPPSPEQTNSRPPPNSSSPTLLISPSGDEQQGNLGPSSPRGRGKSLVEPSHQTTESSTTNLAASNKDKRNRPRALTTGSSTLIPTWGKPLEAVVYHNAVECPVCFLVLTLLTSTKLLRLIVVLPSKHKSYTMLLETHLYRVFCRNETFRTTLPHHRRPQRSQLYLT